MFRRLCEIFFPKEKDGVKDAWGMAEKLRQIISDLLTADQAGIWYGSWYGEETKHKVSVSLEVSENSETSYFLPDKAEKVLCRDVQERDVASDELIKREIDVVVFSSSGEWQVFSNRFGLSAKGSGGVYKRAGLELPRVWDVGQQAEIFEFFLKLFGRSEEAIISP
jgi:hypothetical protein